MAGLFQGPSYAFVPILPGEWNSIPGLVAGGVSTVTGSTNIVCDPNVGNVVVELQDNLTGLSNVTTLGATIGGVDYPEATGTTGYVLGLTSPSTAAWIPGGGGGGAVASVSGSTNIEVDPTTGAVVVTLQDNLTGLSNVTTLEATIGTVDYPNVAGETGQVLTLTSPTTAVWSNATSGAVTEVSAGASGNCTVSPNVGAVVVDIVDAPTFAGLIVQDNFVAGGLAYPTVDAAAGYVVTTDGSGHLSLQPGGGGGAGVSSLSSTTSSIVVSAATGDVELSLAETFAVNAVSATTVQATALILGSAPNTYAFPTSIGTAGQVLAVSGVVANELEFVANSTITSVTGSTNIECETTDGAVLVTLQGNLTGLDNVSTQLLTLGTAGDVYDFPAAVGTPGQVLAVNTLANALEFVTPGGGGGAVESVNASGSNIVVAPNVGIVEISLAADLTGLTSVNTASLVVGPNTFPTTTGTTAEVLSTNGLGVLSWVPMSGGGGGIVSVTGVANQITAETLSEAVTIGLAADITGITSLECGALTAGGNLYPSSAGTPGQVLSTNGSGTLSWADGTGGVSTITSANDLINVITVGGAVTLTAAEMPTFSSITASNATLGGTSFPIGAGTVGQILTANGSGAATWADGGGASGVSSITAGSANITVSPATGDVVVNLGDNISATLATVENLNTSILNTQAIFLCPDVLYTSVYVELPTVLPSVPSTMTVSGSGTQQHAVWSPQVQSNTYTIEFTTPSVANTITMSMTFEKVAGSKSVTWCANLAGMNIEEFHIATSCYIPLISLNAVDEQYRTNTNLTQMGNTIGACFASPTSLSGLRNFVWTMDLSGIITITIYCQNSSPYELQAGFYYPPGVAYVDVTNTTNPVACSVGGQYYCNQ